MTSSASDPSPPQRTLPWTYFVVRGLLGFPWVSLAGFLPWVWFGRWFRNHGGELAMYLTCAVVFITSSGILMHPLILGPHSLRRFYKIFTPAFAVYSAFWIAAWMAAPGHLGSVLGLGMGTAAMAWILVRSFRASPQFLKVWMALFLLNSLGYFAGGCLEAWLARPGALDWTSLTWTKGAQMRFAMASWGIAYGLGFGAGLGLAFYRCQELQTFQSNPAGESNREMLSKE